MTAIQAMHMGKKATIPGYDGVWNFAEHPTSPTWKVIAVNEDTSKRITIDANTEVEVSE